MIKCRLQAQNQLSNEPNAKGRLYKRERVLGRGSFGTAYLVRCRTDSRQYVLKRLDLAHMNKKEQDEAMNEARVLERLRRHRRPRVLDPYGAESPAEFFGVVSEAFFQRGPELARHHARLYALLRDYYGFETA